MATISHRMVTVLMSANDTGTPRDGVVVPHRPGPSSIRFSGWGRQWANWPISRATA